MAVITLNGTRRSRLGKGSARTARARLDPGGAVRHGEDPVPVNVGSREFDVALRAQRWQPDRESRGLRSEGTA